jgi:hypothetical protein
MNTTTTDRIGAWCSGRRITRLPHQVGAEHGKLALGEIDVVGGDEDHHQRQGEARIDGAVGEPGGDLLDQLLH